MLQLVLEHFVPKLLSPKIIFCYKSPMKMTNHKPQDFQALLKEELVARSRKNPSYSLRSFARSLNVTSAALSEMLNGKRTITKKSIEKMGLRLGLSLGEVQFYQTGELTKKQGSIAAASFRQITIDQYSLISDWYHYAIIELLKVKNFNSDANWIAKALGITKSIASIAVERLLRLGLIEKNKEGELADTSSGFSSNINVDLTSMGSKQLQKQILEQSIEALLRVPISERNHTSMTMAIDPKHMPEAIKKITKFRRELCEYLESQGSASEVYQLSISLFPITQIKNDSKPGDNT